jgi:outer membrane protein assembly factor BamA
MRGVLRRSSAIFLVMLAASGPSLSAGQQTASASSAARGEDTAAPSSPQQVKDDDVEPPDEGRLKTTARRLGSLASSDGAKDGMSVSAGIIVAGSNLSGGVGYRRANLFKSVGIEVEGNVSVRLYQDHRAAIGRLNSRSSTFEFDVADSKVTSLFNANSRKAPGSAVFADIRYRDYPQHTYYGTGIDSLEENRSDYRLRGASIEGVWQWQVTPTFGVGVRGGFLGIDIGPGRNDSVINLEDRFIPLTLPGAIDQPQFLTYGVGVGNDTRSEPGAPEDGSMAGVSLRRFSSTSMPELAFTRLMLDVRGYRRVPMGRGVIAARGLVSTDLTGASGRTPFYLQASLGGGETLRGFHSYRFADKALAHASVEYRWRAHKFVEVAPFLDVGTVASGLSRLSLGSVKMTPGIGVRGRTARRTIARLDWGHSNEGHRITLGVGPAF